MRRRLRLLSSAAGYSTLQTNAGSSVRHLENLDTNRRDFTPCRSTPRAATDSHRIRRSGPKGPAMI
jgi:hypothetical protein